MRSGGYVLQDYDGREGDMHAHFCLRGANDDLRNRLTRRFGQLFSAVDCSWNDGGVILSRNGEKAMFIDVNVDCSGNRGFCAGFCGATYGNLGAEHGAYQRGVTLDFSRPGTPTDNAFIEASGSKLRSECLNAHSFLSLEDACEKLEAWRRHDNEERPHSAIGKIPPIMLANSAVTR